MGRQLGLFAVEVSHGLLRGLARFACSGISIVGARPGTLELLRRSSCLQRAVLGLQV